MALFTDSDIDVTVVFDAVNKRVRVTDNVDYSDFEGMPLANLTGLGQMNDPVSDIVFQKLVVSAPLISLSTSAVNSAWFNLPTTNSGQILNGSYPFTYFVSLDVIANDIVVSQITVTTQTVILPGNHDYLIAGNTVVFSGSSNTGNNGTKTVVSSTFDSGLNTTSVIFAAGSFTNNENGSSGTQVDISISRKYEKSYSFTYTGCDEAELCLSIQSSCSDETITFVNSTVYPSGQTVTTRSQKLFYPEGLTPPPPANPVVNTDVTVNAITLDVLANGPWQGTITDTVQCLQDDELVVQYQISGTVSAAVSCETNLCKYLDCIEKTVALDAASISCGASSAYADTVRQLNSYVNIFQIAQSCGDTDSMAAAVAAIKGLVGSTATNDCGCSSGTSGCGCEGCEDGTVSWVGNSANTLLGTAGEQKVIFFTFEELTGAELTASDTVTIPTASFGVGDALEIEMRAEFVGATCDLKMEDVTNGHDLLNGVTLTTGQFANIFIRAVRTDVDSYTVTRNITRLTATPATSVTETETTYAMSESLPLVFDFVPTNVNNVIYNSLKFTTIKKPA
jgi:hypothetical protein